MFIKNRRKTNRIVLVPSHMEPTTVKDMDALHRIQGRFGFGYHYFIGSDGYIETGRPLDKFGNYHRKYNKDSVFVCAELNEGEKVTTEQQVSLDEIVSELRDMYPEAYMVNLL